MTDTPTFHPKPGRITPPLTLSKPGRPPVKRSGFDPASLGGRGPQGPKGLKGRPMPLPGKSRGR